MKLKHLLFIVPALLIVTYSGFAQSDLWHSGSGSPPANLASIVAALGFTPLNPANNLSELSSYPSARASLSAASSGSNSDITSLSGLTTPLSVGQGGTGTNSGSITGTGPLAFAAGGSSQNVTLTPSGSGYTILNGNVGIGTTTPDNAIQVAKLINFDNTLVNTWLGYQAGNSNTTGGSNTANGYASLYSNTTNVATLGAITGGSLYTPGTYTGVVMTLSSGSSAATYPTATIVVSAGGAVSSVTITSPGAGFQDTTTVLTAPAASIGGTGSGFSVPVASLNKGYGNTALGYQAGSYIANGSTANLTATNSLYLGYNAYPLADNDTNETVIGPSAVGNGSNSTTLGNASVTKTIIPAGSVGIGDTTPPTKVSIQDSTVLGTESCSNPADFSQTTWTLAGDFAVNGTAATFTKSSGSGTITQTAANQAQASAGLRKYQIQYIVSAAPTEAGGTMLLTTGFAGASTTLPIAAGTNTVLFYSTASPASIVLSVSGVTSGAFTITSVSVKEIQGGFITVGGGINFGPTLTTAGATGNKTINKSAGQVRIAAAGTTVTVTNNLVTARSIVIAVPASNDTTAQVKNVVAAAGSFTINMVAGVTAETPVSFVVFN